MDLHLYEVLHQSEVIMVFYDFCGGYIGFDLEDDLEILF